MKKDLRTSDEGIAIIKRHEGFRRHWYHDVVGVPTIGYGTTEGVEGVSYSTYPQAPITKEQGDALLRKHLVCIEQHDALQSIKPHTTQNQWDAVIALTYNIGTSAFSRSTMRQHILKDQMNRASHEFSRWVHAGGKVWDGLIGRRAEERALFDRKEWRALDIEPIRPWEMQQIKGVDHEALLEDILRDAIPKGTPEYE